jgi:hypothetical protein
MDDECEPSIDLVELPRLNISFVSKHVKLPSGETVTRLYSVDHADLFITNYRSELIAQLMRGLPHSLLLSNSNGDLQILVPAIAPCRIPITSAPLSTEIVLNRIKFTIENGWLTLRYFLYPVHVSLAFMFQPSLSSALYLLLMRFLNRDYIRSCK